MNEINLILLKINLEQNIFSLVLNIWALVVIIIIVLLFFMPHLIKLFSEKGFFYKKTLSVTFNASLLGTSVEYKITRSYKNAQIAHKIYVELTTRNAALPINEEHDVIVEVYDSWYALFQTTRKELKTLPVELLSNKNASKELTRLLTDILNKGLRPHLTEYQAAFRKWYDESLKKQENENLSPQKIQRKYENYNNLVCSMKDVNQLLIEYAEKLKIIAYGKSD